MRCLRRRPAPPKLSSRSRSPEWDNRALRPFGWLTDDRPRCGRVAAMRACSVEVRTVTDWDISAAISNIVVYINSLHICVAVVATSIGSALLYSARPHGALCLLPPESLLVDETFMGSVGIYGVIAHDHGGGPPRVPSRRLPVLGSGRVDEHIYGGLDGPNISLIFLDVGAEHRGQCGTYAWVARPRACRRPWARAACNHTRHGARKTRTLLVLAKRRCGEHRGGNLMRHWMCTQWTGSGRSVCRRTRGRGT